LTEGRKADYQQQFLVLATFFSFSRRSHLKILVLPMLFFKCLNLPDKIIFKNRVTLGQNLNIEFVFFFKCFHWIIVFKFYVLKMFTLFTRIITYSWSRMPQIFPSLIFNLFLLIIVKTIEFFLVVITDRQCYAKYFAIYLYREGKLLWRQFYLNKVSHNFYGFEDSIMM